MMESIIGAIAPGILVGLVLFYWERRQKRIDYDRSNLEQSQLESDLLRLDLEVATAQLSFAVAMAVKRGTPNGEMEEALERYQKAITKFRSFERKQLIKNENI